MNEEHHQIRIVITAITELLDLTRHDREVSPVPFLKLQQFIQRFADSAHHAKEERVLFSALIEQGLPEDSGPLGCMYGEHEQGRKYAQVMGAAARACLEGDWHLLPELREAAYAWCSLLHAHIEKEELVLYPLALRVLPPEALARMPADFTRVDLDTPQAFRDAAYGVVEAAGLAAEQRPTG